MDSSKRSAGHIMALICIFFWGSAFIASKVIVSGDFRPAQIICCRLLLVFVILSLATRRYLPLGGWQGIKRDRYLILSGLLGTAVYYLLEATALQYTYATNVSLIVTISPLFSTVFDRFLPEADRKPITRSFFPGLAICLIGVALVILNGSRLRLNPAGDAIALAAALAWAGYSFFLNKAQRINEAQDEPLSPLLFTRRQMFYGLLLAAAVFMLSGAHFDAGLLRGKYLAVLLYLALLPSSLCYWLWGRTIGRIGMLNASLYITVIPVVAAVTGALLLHENLTPLSLAGMAAIIAGLIITQDILPQLLRKRG